MLREECLDRSLSLVPVPPGVGGSTFRLVQRRRYAIKWPPYWCKAPTQVVSDVRYYIRLWLLWSRIKESLVLLSRLPSLCISGLSLKIGAPIETLFLCNILQDSYMAFEARVWISAPVYTPDEPSKSQMISWEIPCEMTFSLTTDVRTAA